MVVEYKNSIRVVRRAMNKILGEHIGKWTEVYLDDIVLQWKIREDHDRLVMTVIGLSSGSCYENNFKVDTISPKGSNFTGSRIERYR